MPDHLVQRSVCAQFPISLRRLPVALSYSLPNIPRPGWAAVTMSYGPSLHLSPLLSDGVKLTRRTFLLLPCWLDHGGCSTSNSRPNFLDIFILLKQIVFNEVHKYFTRVKTFWASIFYVSKDLFYSLFVFSKLLSTACKKLGAVLY